MAFRTWAKLLSATLGVGALAGASQLGLAYGLGIVRLTRVLDVTTRDQWTAQLAWVAWFPMVAAVVGALVGLQLLRRWVPEAPKPGLGLELALAFAAAIGAAVVVPLTMQPARTAQIEGVDPVVVIAICAGLGALVGVFAAWAALAQPIARTSLATMGIAVWAIALISVAPSLAPSDPLPAVRLGVFDAGFLSPAVTQRTALATMPALALMIGAALGWLARRQELPTLTIALAGLPGPALLTIAYLVAGPGAGDDRYQVVPYWAAMTATGAGVLGSVLAAVLRRGPGPEDEEELPEEEKPVLPKRTSQQDSAIAAAAARPVSPATGELPKLRAADTGVFNLPPGASPSDPAAPSQAVPPPPESFSAAPPAPSGPASRPGPASPSGPAAPSAQASPSDDLPRKPARLRKPSRRSSVADAFSTRTGEFPAQRPDQPTGGVALGEYATEDPPPFDAFTRGAPSPSATPTPKPSRSASAPWSPSAGAGPMPAASPTAATQPAAEPKPYVPEPATRPLPPEVLQAPTAEQPRPSGGRLGRSLRPFSRGRSAEPLTPEPTAVSAPLPHPEPITPPLAVTPAPGPEDEKRKKTGRKGPKDEDYVDWVSGLGGK